MTVPDLIKFYGSTGYNARRLAEAAEILQDMVDTGSTVCLTLAGAMTPIGLGRAISAMMEKGFIDWIVATGANVYFRAIDFGPVIDHAESLDGGLTTVHEAHLPGRPEAIRTLLTNAKFQGTDDRLGEGPSQAAYALAPLMHTPARDSALPASVDPFIR